MKYSYSTAKLVIAILEVVAWTMVALGLIGIVYFFRTGDNLELFGCLVLIALGFLDIAAGQMAMAQIATAENTHAMLELMQKERLPNLASKRVEPPVTQLRPIRPD